MSGGVGGWVLRGQAAGHVGLLDWWTGGAAGWMVGGARGGMASSTDKGAGLVVVGSLRGWGGRVRVKVD